MTGFPLEGRVMNRPLVRLFSALALCVGATVAVAASNYDFLAAPETDLNRVYRLDKATGEIGACQYGLKEGSVGATLCYPPGEGATAMQQSEYGDKPKPMVEIGGKPMLWHIMRYYSSFGFNEFVVCLGYKGDIIKNFFLNYRSNQGSITVNLKDGAFKKHDDVGQDPWIIHLIETGQNTMTGGRIKRAAQFLGPRRFMATYGDGLSNVDLTKLLAYHMREKRKATITAVRPPARFGGLEIDGGAVTAFTEKPHLSSPKMKARRMSG